MFFSATTLTVKAIILWNTSNNVTFWKSTLNLETLSKKNDNKIIKNMFIYNTVSAILTKWHHP